MLTKRIIPCLDIKDGQTVKGTNFIDLKDAGNPIELAKKYSDDGADELVFLDISATEESRATLVDLVREIAQEINIPFTVGGGISSVQMVEKLLKNGADKVSLNSAAIRNPKLIHEIARQFGNQCLIVAIDADFVDNQWKVFEMGGKKSTDLNLFDWAKDVEQLGAGEILFTSIPNDGTKKGFANEALAQLNQHLSIPVIASGGAGTALDFYNAFSIGKADAALAASVFHFNEIQIPELKKYLFQQQIPIRL